MLMNESLFWKETRSAVQTARLPRRAVPFAALRALHADSSVTAGWATLCVRHPLGVPQVSASPTPILDVTADPGG